MLLPRVNSFTGEWKKVVAEWGRMNGQYLSDYGDFPSWYVENSNSALFAAAAWKCGIPAICEIDVEKRQYTGKRGRPRSYNGRFDLEINFKDETYLIEAKRRFLSLSQSSYYSLRHGFIIDSLKSASKDIRSCQIAAKSFEMKTGALVFFAAIIEPDAHVRVARKYKVACDDLITSEIDKFSIHMTALANAEPSAHVNYAVFSNPVDSMRDWKELNWPAVCGVCAILNIS